MDKAGFYFLFEAEHTTLGDRFKWLRHSKDLSRTELAKSLEINITSTSIANIESNKHSPNIEYVISYSKFFKVSCDWLLTGKEFHHTISLHSDNLKPHEMFVRENDVDLKDDVIEEVNAEKPKYSFDDSNDILTMDMILQDTTEEEWIKIFETIRALQDEKLRNAIEKISYLKTGTSNN